jgi:hypothetical protein
MLKYFLLWLPMPVIAIMNAAIRELLFVKNFSEQTAHKLSTLTIIIFLGIYIYFILDKWRLESLPQAVLTGLLWMVLTVVFEFSIGFAGNKEFSEMIKAYDVTTGNLWILVPLFMFAAPVIYFKFIQQS